MGILNPEKMTRNELCQALTPVATDMINNKPRCANFDGVNLFGDSWQQIPPYLLYTFVVDKLDDDAGKPIKNAIVCADIRDLIRYLDTTTLPQDTDDDDLIRSGSYGNQQRPELYSHPIIKLPHSIRQDIRKRWDILTDYGKNPVNDQDREIGHYVPSARQRVTDLYGLMNGYPVVSINDFVNSDASTLIGYLQTASLYEIMKITESDVEAFKIEPTIHKFLDVINIKSSQSDSINTFMVALIGIINGDDMGILQNPDEPSLQFERAWYLHHQLLHAIRSESDDVIQNLLDSDSSIVFGDSNAFVFALRLNRNENIMRFMINTGQIPEMAENEEILALALAGQYSEEFILLLLARGAPTVERAAENNTISLAINNFYEKSMIQALLESGIDVNGENTVHLFIAIKSATVDIIELLLQKGVNVNVNYNNWNFLADLHTDDYYDWLYRRERIMKPLTWAVLLVTENNWEGDIVEMLISYGADVEAEDFQALRLAKKMNVSLKIRNLLKPKKSSLH